MLLSPGPDWELWGFNVKRLLDSLLQQKQGREHFCFTAVGTTCNKYSFWGESSQVIALVHDVQDVSEPLLITTTSTHHAANIPPTLERQPRQKAKQRMLF